MLKMEFMIAVIEVTATIIVITDAIRVILKDFVTTATATLNGTII